MKLFQIIVDNGFSTPKTYYINSENITGFSINETEKKATIYIGGNTELTSIALDLKDKNPKEFLKDFFNSHVTFD